MANPHPLIDLKAYTQLPLLFDHWYVAGLTQEFSRDLKAKTLLERSIVFYRKEDGSLVALQNRCAHRSFPLAEGKLIGDNIRCGYHGIQFNPEGEVVSVPCQTNCPKRRLKKYPIKEVGPFAWIWMGDHDKADEADIPDTGGMFAPGWRSFLGEKPLAGNYLLIHENLADLSHVEYLHGETVGAPEDWGFADIPVDILREGDRVTLCRHSSDWGILRPFFPPGVDLSGRKITSQNGGNFVTPALHTGWNRAQLLDAIDDEQVNYDHEFTHFITPETAKTTHYWYAVSRNCDLENEPFNEVFEEVIAAAFEEDVFAIRAIQRLLDEDTHTIIDVSISADKAGILVRQVFMDLVDREKVGVDE
jgi:nitrite reductase/ring-hydroxylating ferredoxin subunit